MIDCIQNISMHNNYSININDKYSINLLLIRYHD